MPLTVGIIAARTAERTIGCTASLPGKPQREHRLDLVHSHAEVRLQQVARERRARHRVSGEHALHGFANRDLRHKLAPTPILSAGDALKQSAQVTRLLRRLHAHGLIAKIPHARRWRVSLSGRRVMAAALKLREVAYPSLYADAA